MKNQYFGDVNDYLKYALLRALSGRGEFRTLIAWMLTYDDGGRDGRKLDYLKAPVRYRHLDPEVFDFLGTAATHGRRGVELLPASGLLPNSHFHADFLTDDARARQSYFTKLVARYADTDWVFFDPDNGLEISSRLSGRRDYSKYLAFSEAAYAYRSGLSVLVYQHFPRETRNGYIVRTRDRLLTETGAPAALVFVTPNVGFFLLPQERHQAIVWRRTAFLIQSAGSLLRLWAPDVKPIQSAPRPATPAPRRATSESITGAVITDVSGLAAEDVVNRQVLCPACKSHTFKRWPLGWDAHAHCCAGLTGEGPEVRKAAFKDRWRVLFR